jgi:hypothetical protein
MENKGDGTQPALGFVLGRPIDGAQFSLSTRNFPEPDSERIDQNRAKLFSPGTSVGTASRWRRRDSPPKPHFSLIADDSGPKQFCRFSARRVFSAKHENAWGPVLRRDAHEEFYREDLSDVDDSAYLEGAQEAET